MANAGDPYAEPMVGVADALTADVAAAGGATAPASPACASVAFVFGCCLVMSAAAGLGALPLALSRGRALGARLEGVAHALACGVMLAASFGLIHDGQHEAGDSPQAALLVALGVCLGALFVRQCARWLEGQDAAEQLVSSSGSAEANAIRKTMLFLGVMTLHAFGEGSGVGVSFAGADGWRQGAAVAVAIGVHNVPEGAALSLVLAARGVGARDALAWATLSALPQTLVAVPAFLFARQIMPALPLCMGFAAGTMIYLVVSDMVPEAVEKAGAETVGLSAVASICAFEAFRVLVDAYYGSGEPGGEVTMHAAGAASVLVDRAGSLAVACAAALVLWSLARMSGAAKRLHNKRLSAKLSV